MSLDKNHPALDSLSSVPPDFLASDKILLIIVWMYNPFPSYLQAQATLA
jgi:hypothetical protein